MGGMIRPMSIPHLPPKPPSGPELPSDRLASNAAEGAGVVFEVKKKRLKRTLTKAQIKRVAMRLTEAAESMGLTNDIEQFSDVLADDILQGMRKAAKRIKDKGL